jgi:hypothetical protein
MASENAEALSAEDLKFDEVSRARVLSILIQF